MPNKSRREKKYPQAKRQQNSPASPGAPEQVTNGQIASAPSTMLVGEKAKQFTGAVTSRLGSAKNGPVGWVEGAWVLREMKMIAFTTAITMVALVTSYLLFH
jgi:hypothetical protein